jgi:hypothetical protein
MDQITMIGIVHCGGLATTALNRLASFRPWTITELQIHNRFDIAGDRLWR